MAYMLQFARYFDRAVSLRQTVNTALTTCSRWKRHMATAEYITHHHRLAVRRINLLSHDVCMKQCNRCGYCFSLDQFYPTNRGIYGVMAACKACNKAIVRTIQEGYAHTERATSSVAEKYCYKCKEMLSIASFSRDARTKDGYQGKCKTCSRQIFNAWYVAHAETQRAAKRAYYQDNPEILARRKKTQHRWMIENLERMREHNQTRRSFLKGAPVVDFTRKQWEYLKIMYKQCCAYCGKKQKSLTQDHIIPLSKGGSHTMSNIVPACRSCNSKKRTGPPLTQLQTILGLVIL